MQREDGFTIIELMIALSVLSVLLIMCTVVLISIGSLYTKGVNNANLQSTSRSILTDVSSAIQFNGSAPVNSAVESGVQAICIGTTRYSFVLDAELGDDPYAPGGDVNTPHVLWRDTLKSASEPCVPLNLKATGSSVPPVFSAGDDPGTGGYEMAGDHMSLTNFSVSSLSGSSDAYVVNVWMAYGDYDLVQPGNTSTAPTCKGGTGTQFCGTSVLTTLVTGRTY